MDALNSCASVFRQALHSPRRLLQYFMERDAQANDQRVQRLLSGRSIVMAWIIVLGSLVHPPHGTGISLCWMQATIGTPCPGCGVTRSISCLTRGMWAESMAYHPFGIIILCLFAVIAISGVLPSTMRSRFERRLMRHRRLVQVSYIAFVGAFLLYGAGRAALHLFSYVSG